MGRISHHHLGADIAQPATAHVGHSGRVEEGLVRTNLLDVGDPDLLGPRGDEVALHQVGRRRGRERAPDGLESTPDLFCPECGASA